MRSVLLIDDDEQVLAMLERAFTRAGYAVASATRGEVGLAMYARDAADLVILDLGLPDASGLEILERLKALDEGAVVIMLTGQADLQTAVEAMRAGAENFLSKPVDIAHLYAAADRAFEKIELRRRTSYLQRRHESDAPADRDSPLMRMFGSRLALVAPTETTVLLLGETGTGKNWMARRIHALSSRASGPFVEINCASLSATFLESELFGHEKGAFTDARTMKRGLFEIADNGTLLLDEIGDLSADLQPKLLTALESRRFRRLGGTRDIRSNVRLICATNRGLKQAVADNRFREDLYYRIAVMPIELPPLRSWAREDREQLAIELLYDIRGNTGSTAEFVPEALRLMIDYPWPGNIREMRNVIERALILAGTDSRIARQHLPRDVAQTGALAATASIDAGADLTLEAQERIHIARVLEACGGNRSRAARLLGISRVGLYKKLRRFDLESD